MTENTARKYELEDVQMGPQRPAQIIPLHPTVWQRGRAWGRAASFTSERVADIVLGVTTLLLSGVLFYVLYHGVQNYQIF